MKEQNAPHDLRAIAHKAMTDRERIHASLVR
jgi:hypothetical protein